MIYKITRPTILALVFALLAGAASAAEPIKGKALALDGDTLLLTKADGSKVKIRLWAIDAPEMKVWPWGPRARAYLDSVIEANKFVVKCDPRGKSHDRIVALCRAQGIIDLGEMLIMEGLAVEHRGYGGGFYKLAETVARERKTGIWKP